MPAECVGGQSVWVLREAIKMAAEKELTTPSEWMRRALLRQLREEGIKTSGPKIWQWRRLRPSPVRFPGVGFLADMMWT
jgi:hypothetical protein